MSEDRRCEVRTASDGTKVRVQGQVSDEHLDEMTAWVRGYVDSRCNDPSPFAMPAIVQRIHGRETYTCGREKGHDGEHRWPEAPDAKWQWPAEPVREPSGESEGRA